MPKVLVPRPKAKAANMTPRGKELEFIDKLGSWATVDDKPFGTGLTRLELLRKYLASMHLRKVWGKIDPYEIRDYVEKAIREEEKGQT